MPVSEFIDQLTDDVQFALDSQIDRINLLDEHSPHLTFPHSSQVDGVRCFVFSIGEADSL
jgi:hypothetical protein